MTDSHPRRGLPSAVFTDEDLKRLKASAVQGHSTTFDASSILAFLARLDAAEAVIELSQCTHDWSDHEKEPCDQAVAWRLWQRSKGLIGEDNAKV